MESKNASDTRPPEIGQHHLDRLAIVYVRQSSDFQVQHNTGSTEAQRSQKRYAIAWGWSEPRILTIEDLGLSGTTADRPGYQRIIKLIPEGKVGILIAVDFTRLGREGGLWFQLLNLCAAFDVLVALDGCVYDMRVSGHLVYAKLMAVVSDIDTSYRSETMRRGRIAKAKAGKSVTRAPMGYVQKTWALDPREWVQVAVKSAFREVLRLRSVGKALRSLNEMGIEFPGSREPTKASESLLLDLYRNYAYTGAYEFGKSRTDPVRSKTPRGRVRRLPVPREQRHITECHHEPYLSREEWLEVQRILDTNRRKPTGRAAGRGTALVERRLVCALHPGSHDDRRMMVHYGDRNASLRRPPRYQCRGDRALGGKTCINVPGREVDVAVRDAVLARLGVPRLGILREALQYARREIAVGDHVRRLQLHDLEGQLENLRYRATTVDPTNALVVSALEEAMRDVTARLEQLRAKAEIEKHEVLRFDDTMLEQLRAVSGRLLELFTAETTTNEERKEIVRALVDRVVVTHRTAEIIRLRLVWVDSEPDTDIEILLPPYVHRVGRELAASGLRPCEVGRRLNDMGLLPRTGRLWTAGTAANMIRHSPTGSRRLVVLETVGSMPGREGDAR